MSISSHYEYPGAEAEFGLYNFHSQQNIDQLTDLLASKQETNSRVVQLFGESGSGRHYLLRAAAQYASLGAKPVVVEGIDLDGYEPDKPLHSLLSYLSAQTTGIWSQKLAELSRRVKVDVKVSPPTLLFASLGIKTDFSVEEILEFFEANRRTRAQEKSDREQLGVFLARATQNRTLVLHLRNASKVDKALLVRLLDEVKLNHNLVLALSYEAGQSVFPNLGSALQIQVPPWTQTEMTRTFAERFNPNKVPSDFLDFVWNFGSRIDDRQTFASRLLRAVTGGWLFSDPHGTWQVERKWQKNEFFVKEFTRDLYEPILELELRLSGLDLSEDSQRCIRDFLDLAAMCDPTIPVHALASIVGVEKTQIDEFIDQVDDLAQVEQAHGLLKEVGFQHPGFPPGVLIYRYGNPALPAAILKRRQDTAILATRSLSCLEHIFRADTRAINELFLSLAKIARLRQETEKYETQLGWWTSIDEAEALVSVIGEQLSAGDTSPSLVWQIIEAVSFHWPPALCLALLESYGNQTDGIPDSMRFHFLIKSGFVLLRLGRYAEALNAAEEANVQLPEPIWRSEYVQCLLAGRSEYYLGDYVNSRRHLINALNLTKSNLPPGHLDTSKAMKDLANTLRAQGDYAGARALEEQVLAACRRLLGDEHPDTLIAMNDITLTLWAQGDNAGAQALEEQVLAARRRLLGDEHLDTLTAMANLALMLRAQGDNAGAQALEEQVLAARRRLLGDEHPDTLTAMANLALMLRAQGDNAGAQALEEQVLAARLSE